MEWQTIDSAPRDGSRFLAALAALSNGAVTSAALVLWDDHYKDWWSPELGFVNITELAKYWMLIPSLPKD